MERGIVRLYDKKTYELRAEYLVTEVEDGFTAELLHVTPKQPLIKKATTQELLPYLDTLHPGAEGFSWQDV